MIVRTVLALLVAGQALAQTPNARVQSYVEEIWRETGTPAISVAMFDGGTLTSLGVGYSDLEHLAAAEGSTVYNIGSISKVVAAVAVMQLVESGRVALDDDVRKYVPGFPPKRAPVTLRHLLTHTSGIRHYRSSDFPYDPLNNNSRRWSSIGDAIEIFKNDPLLFEPGAFYHYSSYATNLLQGVIETASGQALEDYLDDHIFGPAGMLQSSLDWPERIVAGRARGYIVEDGLVTRAPDEDVTYKFTGGGMLATVEDLVRFARAINEGHLLEDSTRQLLWSPQVRRPIQIFVSEGETRVEERWDLGLLWRLRQDSEGRRFVYAGGTVKGFNAILVNYVEHDVIVAIAGNGHPVTPALLPALHIAAVLLENPTSAD